MKGSSSSTSKSQDDDTDGLSLQDYPQSHYPKSIMMKIMKKAISSTHLSSQLIEEDW